MSSIGGTSCFEHNCCSYGVLVSYITYLGFKARYESQRIRNIFVFEQAFWKSGGRRVARMSLF